MMQNNNKYKLQIYINQSLQTALAQEADKKGKSVNALIIELLSDHFGKAENEVENELTIRVMEEFKSYCEQIAPNKEFTIADASASFRENANSRPFLGRKIAEYTADGFFKGITASRTKSGSVRRRANGEALYIKRLDDMKEE